MPRHLWILGTIWIDGSVLRRRIALRDTKRPVRLYPIFGKCLVGVSPSAIFTGRRTLWRWFPDYEPGSRGRKRDDGMVQELCGRGQGGSGCGQGGRKRAPVAAGSH
jgi:hypothetical protein